MKKVQKKIKSINEYKEFFESRRSFIKKSLAFSAFMQLGLLQSCVKEFIPPDDTLNKKQYNILIRVQEILFPKDRLGPGAFDFNAHEYLLWILNDKRLDPEDRQYLIDGIGWVEETAQEDHSESFLELSGSSQEQLILKISRLEWGESWLSQILNYIFEAMISDPLYGYNKNGIGWKWIEHQAGYPRPDKELLYDQIFLTVAKNDT